MKTLHAMLFPHEEALSSVLSDCKARSARERLEVLVANRDRLTRDQQNILREGLVVIESSRLSRPPHKHRLPNASITAAERNRLQDEQLAEGLLLDLATPYARAGKDQILGAAAGGPEAARYAQSYIPLSMDARDYLWGNEDMDQINQMRKAQLAVLDDREIEDIMAEHKELITLLYENPSVAQYYPGVPATEESRKHYPLERALKSIEEQHKQLWIAVQELRTGLPRFRTE